MDDDEQMLVVHRRFILVVSRAEQRLRVEKLRQLQVIGVVDQFVARRHALQIRLDRTRRPVAREREDLSQSVALRLTIER